MKSINLRAIITSLRAKADGSLGMNINTPELKPEEKTLFFQLQNLNIDLKITPLDTEETPDEVTINTDLELKTPSQRLRGSLWRWQEKQLGHRPTNEEWEPFYRQKMEKLIEWVQNKIDE